MSLTIDQQKKAHELFYETVSDVARFHPYAGRISQLPERCYGPDASRNTDEEEGPYGNLRREHITFSGLADTSFEGYVDELFPVPPSLFTSKFAKVLEPQDIGEPLYGNGRIGFSNNVYLYDNTSSTGGKVAFGGIVNMEESGRMCKARWVHEGLRFRVTAGMEDLKLEYSSGIVITFKLTSGPGVRFEGSGICPKIEGRTDLHLVTSASFAGVPNFQGFYGVQLFFMNNRIDLVRPRQIHAGGDDYYTELKPWGCFHPTPTVDQSPVCKVVGMAFDDDVGTKVWMSEKLPVAVSCKEARRLIEGCPAKVPNELPMEDNDRIYDVYRWGEVRRHEDVDKGVPYFRAYNQLARKGLLERMDELNDDEFVDVE